MVFDNKKILFNWSARAERLKKEKARSLCFMIERQEFYCVFFLCYHTEEGGDQFDIASASPLTAKFCTKSLRRRGEEDDEFYKAERRVCVCVCV